MRPTPEFVRLWHKLTADLDASAAETQLAVERAQWAAFLASRAAEQAAAAATRAALCR